VSICPNCQHEIHPSDAVRHSYLGAEHLVSRCIELLHMDIRALKEKREAAIAIIRDRAKRARERHAVDKTSDSFLNDGDLAMFYDVLAGEIEAL
jgi:hypothetical protein